MVDIHNGKLAALLSDFDSAKDFDDLLPRESYDVSLKLSHHLMAPEYCDDVDLQDSFDNGAGDMWAFGCVMVEVRSNFVVQSS